MGVTLFVFVFGTVRCAGCVLVAACVTPVLSQVPWLSAEHEELFELIKTKPCVAMAACPASLLLSLAL